MPYVAFDGFHTTIASIVAGIGKITFDLTSATGFPALAAGDFTVLRIDDLGTPEDVIVTARSGVTCTCLPTTVSHAAGNSVDGSILDAANAFPQIKDDALSGFPENALSAAGALVKGTGVNNHITLTSVAATFTLANGSYKGELCRISVDRTSTKQATIDPASTTTWDGALTKALIAGDVLVGGWDGTEWKTIFKTSVFASPDALFIANNWYWAHNLTSAAGAVHSATVTRYVPFYVPYTITISDLGIRVGTTSAGGKVKIGIYANGTNNQPNGAVLGNTGDLSTTTAAVVTGALGANLQLTPGYYWFAVQCDNATATLSALSPTTGMGGFTMGGATASNLANSVGNSGLQWTATTTYGTFGTNPTITEGNVTPGNIFPQIMFKIASVP